MAPALPRQVVVIVESIVAKNLRIGVGTDIARIVTDALPGESRIKLRANERNPDLGVSGQAEVA